MLKGDLLMPKPSTATQTPTGNADEPADSQQPERIIEWPPAEAFHRAEEIKREHGYYDADSASHARLSAGMITQLTRLAQTIATPDALITTEPPTEGKPYTSTGLSSLQPQIDVMHAIFGPPHWRLREQEVEDGVLDLELVIGNDLDAPPRIDSATGELRETPAEVLLRHRMRGSHTRGRSHGDRYKGALTNGAKRLLAMGGACADVWRFGPDPDEAHNAPATAARDARKPTDKQVNFLARLVRENAGPNIDRWITRIQELAGVDEQPPETITEDYVREVVRQLDREQAGTLIDALIVARDAGAQAAAPASAPPSRTTNGQAAQADAPADAAQPRGGDAPAHGNGAGDVVSLDFGGLGPATPGAA
jgi:hypothetical protein